MYHERRDVAFAGRSAVAYGVLMTINVAWPRASVYNQPQSLVAEPLVKSLLWQGFAGESCDGDCSCAVCGNDRDATCAVRPLVASSDGTQLESCITVRMTVLISIMAKLAPMQRRSPPPNGMNVYGAGRSKNRSGRKRCGSE